MIIPNKFIQLDYNPTTDVLFIDWPNIHDYTLPELKFILDEIVDTVKHYDIKRILTDSRKSAITLPDAEYAGIVNQWAINLTTTRLQKFARLTTNNPNREKIANNAAALVVGTIQFMNFENAEAALEWLNS
jgi:hypothetical protein